MNMNGAGSLSSALILKSSCQSREMAGGEPHRFRRRAMPWWFIPQGTARAIAVSFSPVKGLVFLGDLDMTSFGPWYGDRVSDIDQTIASVRKILEIPADVFISAHDTGIIRRDEIALRAEAYIEVIDRREAGLLKFLEAPHKFEEIIEQWICYGKRRDPDYFFEFGERGLIRKHLERLEEQGRVSLEDDRYVRLF